MYFNSLEQILNQLEKQPGWEKFRNYRQLLKCWQNTVSPTISLHTRPLYIDRQVLWVATSSAARAQELFFQRYSLLKKLNNQLPFTLKDIRFSSSHWHHTLSSNPSDPDLFKVSTQQKSKIYLSNSLLKPKKLENDYAQVAPVPSSPTNAKISVDLWLKKIQRNSATFLSCPNCKSPTPPKEIERWNLCYHCIAQKWSQEYRPATFTTSQ